MAKTNPNVEISSELVLGFSKERKEFVEGVFNYELPQTLADKAFPLKFKEIAEFKKKGYSLENLEADGKMDIFIADLLGTRGITELDELSYPDILMFGHKVLISTFDAKSIAAKK